MTVETGADTWFRSVEGTVRFAIRTWLDHRTIRLGAGLAYYWLVAIVPLAILAFWLAAVVFPIEKAL